MKEKSQPPVPPGAIEPTIAFERSPPPARPKVDWLLPPGAEEATAPPASIAPPRVAASFTAPHPIIAASAEMSVAPAMTPAKARSQSLEEKGERRFWKNAIVFGVSIVVLLIVFYWLAR